jgi:hypothetical protein
MNANSIPVKPANAAWPRLYALALALSIAGCGTTGGHVSSMTSGAADTQVAQRDASATDVENGARPSAIGKVAEAGARGIGGAALGVIAGAFRGLQCGLLAPICVPISAVVHGVAMGAQAFASTPGLGDATGDTRSDDASSRSSAEVESTTAASAADVHPDTSDVAILSPDVQLDETTSDGESSPSSAEVEPLTTPPASDARRDASVIATPSPDIQLDDTTSEQATGRPSLDVDSLTTASASERPMVKSEIAISSPGIHLGDRWDYVYVDSRNRESGTRRFEITELSASIVKEQIALQDGRTIFAEHHGGAYLSMVGGMQFAPYYFVFQSEAGTSPVSKLKVEGGDPCGEAPVSIYNTYECEVSAVFEGSESVTVPAGTFQAQRVRVKIYQQVWGTTAAGSISGVIAYGQYWVSPKAGRVVKAVITHEVDGTWTETLELISFRARSQE